MNRRWGLLLAGLLPWMPMSHLTAAEAASKVKSTAKKATPTKASAGPIKVIREVESPCGQDYEYTYGIWSECEG
jgi:hypothetical protein